MTKDLEKKEDDRSWVKSLGLLSVVVSDIVGCTAVGIGVGLFLSRQFGWPNFIVVLFALIGLGIAFYHIYLVAQRLENK